LFAVVGILMLAAGGGLGRLMPRILTPESSAARVFVSMVLWVLYVSLTAVAVRWPFALLRSHGISCGCLLLGGSRKK
jgi:hypothetical protein